MHIKIKPRGTIALVFWILYYDEPNTISCLKPFGHAGIMLDMG